MVSPCLVIFHQSEILMYHCRVNERFPSLPSFLGGEFSGFKPGKALGRANYTEPCSVINASKVIVPL